MSPTSRKVTTILFDCDNTLVLSEPLAFAACSDLSNAILDAYAPHVSHRYNGPELQREFVGKNFRALIAALEEKHGFEVPSGDVQGWVDKELGTTIGKIRKDAVPCEGVIPILSRLRDEQEYKMAVVSSSALPRVLASIEKTNQDIYFPPSTVFSAASMTPPTSKPDPAVYLFACEQLGVRPGECIAIEDSKSGATAATRAGIPLVGYVGPYYEEGQEEVDRMVRVLTEECGAKAILHHWDEFFSCMEAMQQV